SFSVDSSKGIGEKIFISQDSLTSGNVLQILGHELGHLAKYDKDEKTADNVGNKIEEIKAGEEKDYNEYLASIKDKYKDLPSLEESKELEKNIPDEYKEKLGLIGAATVAGVVWLFSSEETGDPILADASKIKKDNGKFYYVDENNKKYEIKEEYIAADGSIIIPIEPSSYELEVLKNTVIVASAAVIGSTLYEMINTGTVSNVVWDNITPTQPNMEKTLIPKSFTIKVGEANYWVHPNATEHMQDHLATITKTGVSHNFPLKNQMLLKSFESSLKELTKRGNILGEKYTIGNWEIMINQRATDKFPVVYHAVMKGQ
ncbi:hypothetical protein, partial [Fusobacterium sp.]|uniref:hypothetical protein n=1 Tax=Fusobacterium sp. TaxID=68766 RepID=UPI0029024C63|nr:hypothetical protein [Fusobacterium sp.]